MSKLERQAMAAALKDMRMSGEFTTVFSASEQD